MVCVVVHRHGLLGWGRARVGDSSAGIGPRRRRGQSTAFTTISREYRPAVPTTPTGGPERAGARARRRAGCSRGRGRSGWATSAPAGGSASTPPPGTCRTSRPTTRPTRPPRRARPGWCARRSSRCGRFPRYLERAGAGHVVLGHRQPLGRAAGQHGRRGAAGQIEAATTWVHVDRDVGPPATRARRVRRALRRGGGRPAGEGPAASTPIRRADAAMRRRGRCASPTSTCCPREQRGVLGGRSRRRSSSRRGLRAPLRAEVEHRTRHRARRRRRGAWPTVGDGGDCGCGWSPTAPSPRQRARAARLTRGRSGLSSTSVVAQGAVRRRGDSASPVARRCSRWA